MHIRFHCDDCGTKIKVPEGAEGRQVKCPRCGAVHRVPAEAVVKADPVGPKEADLASSTADDLDSLASAVNELPSDDDFAEDDAVPSPQFEDDLADALDELEPAVQDDENEGSVQEEAQTPFESEDEDQDGDDPLAALASMADDDEPPSDLDFEQDEALDESIEEDLFADEQTEPVDPPSTVMAATPVPSAQPAIARPVGIPLARPKPKPNAKYSTPSLVSDESIDSASSQSISSARPPSPQPRAVPLSNQPSARRYRVKPTSLELGALESGLCQTLLSVRMLPMLGWLLRVMAFLTLGGAIKLMLVASSALPFMECLLVFLYGLVVTVVVWTLAEITLIISALLPDQTALEE